SLNSFNCSGNYKNNREIESETSNDLKKDRGIEGLAVELRRFEESIDREIEVQKDRGPEESSASVVGFHRWCVSILPLLRRTQEDRETVVVSNLSFEQWWFRSVEDRWWFLSVEDRSVEDRWSSVWRICGG
ncbi:unnamed protein product, partial [Brassica oleracea]